MSASWTGPEIEAQQSGQGAGFAPLSSDVNNDRLQQTLLPASAAPDVGNVGHYGARLDDHKAGQSDNGGQVNEPDNQPINHLPGSDSGRGGGVRIGDAQDAIQHRASDRISGGRESLSAQLRELGSAAGFVASEPKNTSVKLPDDKEKTLVANSPQSDEDKGESDENKIANSFAESIAVEPLKSSKHGWLIRLRLNDLPGRPAVPVTYKTDQEYKALRRSKQRYDRYKKSIKAEYQASIRKGQQDDSGS